VETTVNSRKDSTDNRGGGPLGVTCRSKPFVLEVVAQPVRLGLDILPTAVAMPSGTEVAAEPMLVPTTLSGGNQIAVWSVAGHWTCVWLRIGNVTVAVCPRRQNDGLRDQRDLTGTPRWAPCSSSFLPSPG